MQNPIKQMQIKADFYLVLVKIKQNSESVPRPDEGCFVDAGHLGVGRGPGHRQQILKLLNNGVLYKQFI